MFGSYQEWHKPEPAEEIESTVRSCRLGALRRCCSLTGTGFSRGWSILRGKFFPTVRGNDVIFQGHHLYATWWALFRVLRVIPLPDTTPREALDKEGATWHESEKALNMGFQVENSSTHWVLEWKRNHPTSDLFVPCCTSLLRVQVAYAISPFFN